jgi:hypothetical protein
LVVAVCCVAGLLVLPSASMSCTAPRTPLSIEHEDPGIKIPAIKKAVREKDKSAVPKIVEQLDSDDPAVRFYAIQALEDLTGETFEYQYYHDEGQRKPAIEKWKNWVAGQGK